MKLRWFGLALLLAALAGNVSEAQPVFGSQRETPVRREIKVFHLVHGNAKSVGQILVQLFDDVNVVVDERLNAILVRDAPDDSLADLEAVVIQLDQPAPERPAPPTAAANLDLPTAAAYDAATTLSVDSAAIRDLARRKGIQFDYSKLRVDQAAELARQWRQLQLADADVKLLHSAKSRLRAEVVTAFEARQQAQRMELEMLSQRLRQIEQAIAARERIKDRIIERRVEELLDPALRWDTATTGAPIADAQITGVPTPVPPTPAPAGPGGYPPGAAPRATEYFDDVQVLEARLDAAAKRLDRVQTMSDAGRATGAELQEAAANLKVAEAELAVARRRHEQQRELLKIDLREAEAKFEAARQEYQRVEALHKTRVISGEVYERLRAAADQAQIAVERAKTKLEFHLQSAGSATPEPDADIGDAGSGTTPGRTSPDGADPGSVGPRGTPPGDPGSAAKSNAAPGEELPMLEGQTGIALP